ncbi:MAG: polyprenyl synthetase family protein [Bacteroidaceae bacterium]|nr:polyprenyl synthetase family protein [Bacteroidaceae bacterium]
MDALTRIQQPISEEMARYDELFSEALHHDNPLLHIALEHLSKRKGKRMRPILMLLTAKLYGTINDAVLNAAVSLELLHTASLVHDDVVDESDRRRGQQSINALLDNRSAVLVGDYLLSKALQFAAQTGNVEFVNCVAGLGQTLADGELVQLNNIRTDAFDEGSYYEVVGKKTASLFATCAQAGVMLGGGSPDDAERMRQFGKLLGICFQLRDDIFDFIRVDVGKPAGHDMKEGKLTLPVLFAINKCECIELMEKDSNSETAKESRRMRQLALAVRHGEATDQDVADLVAYTRRQNGLEYAQWAMDEFRMMSGGLISEEIDSPVRQALQDYVDFAAERLV